ncbi:predicted protein [Botrytis cinerea T4]|uniref:Uncharacterized protein n=1 Tax=Botryotinia fuckeliana (strain T4) TaxID=999810 RepID=G2Y4K6_BOTF4|nr:predicted protein [Botrytis cinerea T4]
MGHILTYHTHGHTHNFTLPPPISDPPFSPPPSPSTQSKETQTYAAYAARYTHIYPENNTVHLGILAPSSRIPATSFRASLSSTILAQRSAITRFKTLKATNRDEDVYYLPVHSEEEFRSEINAGVGFYLDIYCDDEDVVPLINKWPFDDATKGLIPGKLLPDVDLILRFDRLNEKLHKLGKESLGYHVKYHCIPKSKNREVELDVIAELDRYAAEMKEHPDMMVEDVEEEEEEEEEEESEETPIPKTSPRPKATPTSKSSQNPTLTPDSTPAQKPMPKLKIKINFGGSILNRNPPPEFPEL